MKTFRTLLALTASFAMFSFAHAAADRPQVGDPAPVAIGTTETGAELNLADVYTSSPYTLVFFYPKAFTPGCTAQNCSLRDGYEALTKLGVTIIGVSTDTVEKQKKFKDEYRLPYTLIADINKVVIKAFGQNSLIFASRQAFLIHDGKVVYADTKGSTKQQADDILKFLSAQ
jgi:thioredoxin-dependent peroxiredoxin